MTEAKPQSELYKRTLQLLSNRLYELEIKILVVREIQAMEVAQRTYRFCQDVSFEIVGIYKPELLERVLREACHFL